MNSANEVSKVCEWCCVAQEDGAVVARDSKEYKEGIKMTCAACSQVFVVPKSFKGGRS